ncbi:unnamed protein product [Mytilus edulis]|uniref:Uncharacterized protein n=1 Tax=Mytilus edulis TaxID=6550 RepID=A0A8S3RL61_MYTED|nr:unnamed protein product [Mytilus edulis]
MHGSKALIETLHSHGFCASYHEVRRYLTSLACSELSQVQNNTYIPSGIRQYNGTVSVIHEGADNVDINAETIDGKDTFPFNGKSSIQVCEEINGKIWGDGGLRDLLVDSGVYAAATVDQMLSGKQFNRAVRGLTLLYETLKTLWICSFFVWIRQQKCLEIPESLFVGLTECHESFTSNDRTFDMLQSLESSE